MSCLRNTVPRKAHKERAQPYSRRKFGLLEKHKDYVERARAYHKKEQTLQKLKKKAAFRNPDEFYFKMIKAKTVGRVHRMESEANKYTQEELMLMKTQDIGYISQKLQIGEKGVVKCVIHGLKFAVSLMQKTERLNSMLHSLDNRSSSRHVYYADDRDEAKKIRAKIPENRQAPTFENLPKDIRRTMAASYRELEARKSRVCELDKICMDMELQKKGRKRKLREDELVCTISRPVYKWRRERKR